MAEQVAQVELQDITKSPENTDDVTEQEKTEDVQANGEVNTDSPSVVEGTVNPAFTEEQESVLQDNVPPPMTFVDFMPMLIEEGATNADAPIYSEFSTVLEQANQWIKGNPNFKVMKFESFVKKLSDKDVADLDQVMYHESSYGVNKYLRGLRLWLAPRVDPEEPIQEIGYLTTLPEVLDDYNSESSMSIFRAGRFRAQTPVPAYCGMQDMMDRLNKFLKKRPIPGSILNVETVKIKYDEYAAKSLDSEKMCWADCGKEDRVYIYAIRVYYVIGKPAFEVVGHHDEIPVCMNNWDLSNKIRFCPFTTVVQRAKNWLRAQKGIRVMNMQTVEIFSERTSKGEAKVYYDVAGHAEARGHDIQYARVLRIFFIQGPKDDTYPYKSLELTTRLFIPSRRGGWGKNCETFSKTMQRVITWLQLTKTPIFGIETVNHPFSPDSYGTGVRENDSVVSLVASSGKYFITTVRVYFPCEFTEPDPALLPKEEDEEGWWACSVS